MEEQFLPMGNWAPLAGKWQFERNRIVYLGPLETQPMANPFGVAVADLRLRSGRLASDILFPANQRGNAGRILFGYNPETRSYLSSGIGGYSFEYVLDEFDEGRGWRALAAAGSSSNIPEGPVQFSVETLVRGQRISVFVDRVRVIVHNLPRPLEGDQVGLFAWGPGPVEFRNPRAATRLPTAFVVMQFGDPYDSLYSEVIKPIVIEKGFHVYRADEVYRPGVILQDITSGIIEAEVIIAEITPPNPNVFYELGYSHAVGKSTILLAEHGKDLPFDIRGFRCIFYENTIKGKKEVESNLRRHLSSILQEA
jgi:hypothetical protein